MLKVRLGTGHLHIPKAALGKIECYTSCMSEQPPEEKPKAKRVLTPEELLAEEAELEAYAAAMLELPSSQPKPRVTVEEQGEWGPHIAEFEGLCDAFENEFSLPELHAITELTPEDADLHPIRYPAKLALNPIEAKLTVLKNADGVSPEKLLELKLRYERLSQAVGIINNDKVDHTREVKK